MELRKGCPDREMVSAGGGSARDTVKSPRLGTFKVRWDKALDNMPERNNPALADMVNVLMGGFQSSRQLCPPSPFVAYKIQVQLTTLRCQTIRGFISVPSPLTF